MSSITSALIDNLTESEDFIDKLFANEYFHKKITRLVENKIKLDKCTNLENILWINKSEGDFITSYEEFIKLTDSDIKKFYESNDFNLYKHFIKLACLEGKIKPVYLDSHQYGIKEIFVELIHNNQTIPNVFEPFNYESNIAYTLVEKYYPTYLNLKQICQISGVKTIDEFYNALPDSKYTSRSKKKLFVSAGILVNYFSNTQVDTNYVKKILDDELPYQIKSIDYFSNVYEKYSYPKIPMSKVLEWFDKAGDSVVFKKNSNYTISLSYTIGIKQTIKNFFEKVCTKFDIIDESIPYYIKYTEIMTWLNTK